MTLYPQVPYLEWAERHGISTESIECSKCKHELKFNIPIALKGYFGLATGPCGGCSFEQGAFRVVPVSERTIAFWKSHSPY